MTQHQTKIKHHRVAVGMFILAMAALVFLMSLTALAGAASEQQPNLEALPAHEFSLVTAGDGTTNLRFSTTTWNSGLGPLELVAGATGAGKQDVYQRIYLDGGGYTDYLAGNFEWHEAHNHFHFEDYALYSLQPADAPGASGRTSNKTTFCVIDTDRIDHKLPGAPKKRVYSYCDNQFQGMSVGWGDTYRYYLAGQSIDVTGLADGNYTLTIEVDPKDRLIETNEGDNTSQVLLHINITDGTVSTPGSGGGGGNHPGNGRCPAC